MGIHRFKIAINNATIPYVSSLSPRAVVSSGLDAAPRSPRVFFGTESSADYNMAKLIYAENVMPMSEGIRSVGYTSLIPGLSSIISFNTIFPLRDALENYVLYSPASNSNYIHNARTNLWVAQGGIEAIHARTLHATSNPATAAVTYAYVDGRTFVCYARMRSADPPVDMSILEWNPVTQQLQPTTLIPHRPAGIAVGEIDGISSSSGFLIMWSGLRIAWAPFVGNIFDFRPFVNGAFTGAGVQIPEDIQAPVTAVIAVAGGFIAFTKRNAVAASFHAQSLASPWVFREVASAGGLSSYEQATVEGNLARIYAYTSSGLQRISINSAETIHPELADFITGRLTERYDPNLRIVQSVAMPIDMLVKVTSIGNRYIVVSYGYWEGLYSYALIFDLVLERWGKLRILHRDCFNYVYAPGSVPATYGQLIDVMYSDMSNVAYNNTRVTGTGITAAQNAIAFLKNTGEVLVLSTVATDAVAIIGRVQVTRNANTQLNRIEAEHIESGSIFVQSSSTGTAIDFVHPTTPVDATTFGCMVDCKNFNLVVAGSFRLTTLIVEVATSGRV